MNTTNAFQRKSNITFMKALDDAKKKALWPKIATKVKSTGASETYEWLGDYPGVKRFVGTRQHEAFRDHSYTLTNVTYEDTISIKQEKLDDNPGYVEPRLPGMAQKFANHPSRLMIDLLVDGTTETCYDGKAFFATDHPVDGDAGNTFSNLLTGAGVTVAHIKTDWQKVQTAFLRMEGRDGDTLFDEVGTVIIVHPPEIGDAMKEAFKAQLVATGGTNVILMEAQLVPSGRLSDVEDWYALKVDEFIKPLILQERQGPTMKWSTDEEFDKMVLLYGGKARYVGGYALPQLAIKVNN